MQEVLYTVRKYQISSDQTTLKSMYSLKTTKTLSWLSLGLTHIIQSSQKNEWSGSSTLHSSTSTGLTLPLWALHSVLQFSHFMYIYLYTYMVCLILIALFLGLYFFLLQALITFLDSLESLAEIQVRTHILYQMSNSLNFFEKTKK